MRWKIECFEPKFSFSINIIKGIFEIYSTNQFSVIFFAFLYSTDPCSYNGSWSNYPQRKKYDFVVQRLNYCTCFISISLLLENIYKNHNRTFNSKLLENEMIFNKFCHFKNLATSKIIHRCKFCPLLTFFLESYESISKISNMIAWFGNENISK